MNYNILAYALYLLIILYIVIYVGAVFYKNGAPFLLSSFHGDQAIATAVNRFLLVAYYLFNIGYSIVVLRIWEKVEGIQSLIEVLAQKAGGIILMLGVAHMFNVISLLLIGRRKTKEINQSIHK